MKSIFSKIAMLLLLSSVAVSCISDKLEECPPMHITIEVKDKNYFNVDLVDQESRKSENLAFREYVPTLHYSIVNLETEEMVVHSDFITVTGDDKVFNINLPQSLPFGTYSIQVWGGLSRLDPLGDDHATLAFHPDNTQGRDIYLTCDTIVYSPTSYHDTVWLERTKGKLIIQLENLPEGMEYSDKIIDGLFGGVDNEFSYTDETTVETSTHWSGSEVITKTVLSPSIDESGSTLELVIHDGSLYDDDVENNYLDPYTISVTMNRNELTVVRYVWHENIRDFDIFLLVNDAWECIHGMQLD